MKQADIDNFKQAKIDLANEVRKVQEELHKIHSTYQKRIKEFKCDHFDNRFKFRDHER